MHLPFSKYHGLGNDFIVLDLRDHEAVAARLVGAAAIAICDRHRGVGADGLLLLTGAATAPRMTVINADGSVPEMCGNGLRCFVKYVIDRITHQDTPLSVITDAGTLRCEFERDAAGLVSQVSVTMGSPSYAPEAVPLSITTRLLDQAVEVDGVVVHLTGVGTGNPHAVLFDVLTESQRHRLGPLLSRHELFPAQANVEFCQIMAAEESDPQERSDRQPDSEQPDATLLRCDVYERGCGWTQACGTGATAAATVAVRLGHAPQGRPVRVRLPGGWLQIDVTAAGGATMTGPAAHVFDGTLAVVLSAATA